MAIKDPLPADTISQIETALVSLASNTNAAMMLYRDGKMSFMNPAAERFTGYNAEEMIGSDAIKELLSQEGNDIYLKSIENRLKSSVRFEATILTKSGETRLVDLYISYIGDSDPPINLITMMDSIPKKGPGGSISTENYGSHKSIPSSPEENSTCNHTNQIIDAETNYTEDISPESSELLSEANQRLEKLRGISEDIACSSTIEQRLEAIAKGIVEQLGFDFTVVSILDKAKQTLSQAAIYPMGPRIMQILKSFGWELNNIEFPYDPGVNPIRDQLRAGIPYLGHSLADLLCPPLPRREVDLAVQIYGIQTILDIPLTVDDEVLGFLLILSRQKTISQEDRYAAELVSRQAAAAIETANTLEDLKQRSQELEEALVELEKFPASLEKRVDERTSEIQAQKQFFEALVLNNPIAVVMLDLEHNIAACNPAFEELFGYSQQEVLGKYLDDIIAPPDGYEEATAYTQKVLSGKTVRSTRKRRTKTGDLVDVELFGVPVMVDGQQIGVLGLYNDISERVKAETALRESEERLDLALSSACLGMWDKDFLTGNTVYNQMWAEMLGYSLDEFDINVDLLYELIHPDDYLHVKDVMDAHMKGRTPFFEVTHRMKAKSGEWKCILNTGKVVDRDENKIPLRAVGVHMDITERIQAEQALQKSEERYQVLFESAPDAYYLIDLAGNFVDGNRFAEQLIGYKREELIGKNVLELDILPKTQFPKATKLLAMNVLGKPTGPDEFTLKCKDGTHVDIAIRTFPVEIDGQSLVLGIARDVTKRKRIEAQQQRTNRELALINELSQEISARLEPEQVYNAIHRAASQLMPADVFVIALLDELNQKIDLVYISEQGERIPSLKIGITEGLSGHVISSGEALITGNFDQTHKKQVDSISVGDSDRETQSVLAVPMKRGEKTIGMLSSQSFETNAFNKHDQQMLEMFSSHAQLALENAHLFAEVQRLAITDGLTDLYNRFYFDQQLWLEFDRVRRYDRSLGMVIIDPDHFKQVNDQFGHPAGDAVLMMFAELIKSSARKSDIVARYGGDEFVILLPETNLSGTLSLAEKIRDAVNAHTFLYQDHHIRFTTSIGVAATSGQDISDPDILTKQADQALYEAKRRGRNQVCCNSND